MLLYINDLCRREFQRNAQEHSGVGSWIILEYIFCAELSNFLKGNHQFVLMQNIPEEMRSAVSHGDFPESDLLFPQIRS